MKEKKTYNRRLESGRRQQRKLMNQHHLVPWKYIFWLTVEADFNMKRFRRRLSDLNQDRFHGSWSIEIACGASREHFSGVIRTERSTTEFRDYILDCLATRKRDRTKVSDSTVESDVPIDLRIKEFDEKLLYEGSVYLAKSDYNCLKRNELQQMGKREFFTTGKPWTQPSSELIKLTADEKRKRFIREMECDPALGTAFIANQVTEADLSDGRFLWKWRNGYFAVGSRDN